MNRPFQSDLVIQERISESRLRAYHVGFDQRQFRFLPLVDVIRRVIPEFALGIKPAGIPLTDLVDRLKEAAITVYTTDKYQRRGEFGELILHLLLRDFCKTLPLVSKIYFKDSQNVPVHGFDGVHVTPNDRKLWLGESKLYSDGKEGVADLADDVQKHVNAKYLESEFLFISRKIPVDYPEVEYWRQLMHKDQKLDTIYSSIVIPLVCTYSSAIFNDHKEDSADYFSAFQNEVERLNRHFCGKLLASSLEIILFLLPVPDKDELNQALDQRLKHMQSI